MRITTSQLRRIIKEEAQRVLGTRRRAPVRRRRGLFEADHLGAASESLVRFVRNAFTGAMAFDDQGLSDLEYAMEHKMELLGSGPEVVTSEVLDIAAGLGLSDDEMQEVEQFCMDFDTTR